MEYFTHTLSNAIRILFVPNNSTITHSCILINTGSRDEEAEKSGLAHFIEHVLFKRTIKRNTHQILNRMESVGGDLNAYTTKEYTCLHASFLQKHLERALELFQDIIFQSVFPPREIDKEKGIILDEIAAYQDTPEEAIFDDFEDLLYKNHPLGRNILGTEDSVKKITRESLLNFIKKQYKTNQIILAVMGDYKPQKVFKLAEKHYAHIPQNTSIINCRKPFIPLPATHVQVYKPITQTHMMIGRTAYHTHHKDKIALLLLNNYLGGLGMSTRLNLIVREKHGIAYTIESNYTPLSDTGIFTIYFGTDEEKVLKAQKLIHQELNLLCKQGLSQKVLSQAKQKLIGQIALNEENKINLIISMAKNLIDHQKIDTPNTLFEKINAVSLAQINQVAKEILDPNTMSSLRFSPH